MRTGRLLARALLCAGMAVSTVASAQTASPSAPPPSILRAIMANAPLPNVVDAPRHFRLVRVSLPARQATSYEGAVGFILVLNGSLEVRSGDERQQLARGEGALIPGGRRALIRAEAEPATFLHFVLITPEQLKQPMESAPATVAEVRTTPAIPGLKAGPYEFTLVKVTFPPRLPPNPPHHRSGAALYYVLSGTGAFVTGGKIEPRASGSIQYEPSDLVHQWGNPGDAPLVIIQANISQEGVPVVILEQPGRAAR